MMRAVTRMNDGNGLLVIFSAPSGCGKDTLLKELLKRDENMRVSVSMTTRKPRDNEIDGVSYHFVSKEAFEERIKAGRMLEFAKYGGNYYGTPKEPVDKWLANGKTVFLKIEVQGAEKIRRIYPNAVSIFIMPPSMTVLMERLHKRGTETDEAIIQRAEIAKTEMERSEEYDYIVVNDDLDEAVDEITEIIKQFKY